MADLVVDIIHYGDGKLDRVSVPIADGTTIVKGEVLCYEAGKATKMDAATDDATFLGISEEDHVAGGNTRVTVITRCIAQAPVSSAAYTMGQGLKWVSGALVTDGGSADTIANSVEDTGGASVTSLKVLFDSPLLKKLFSQSA